LQEKNAKSRQLNNPRKPTFFPPHKKNFDDDTKSDKTTSDVVTGKNVQVGIVKLGEGRFAIIKRADLLRGNQKIVVAVKALQSKTLLLVNNNNKIFIQLNNSVVMYIKKN